MFYDYICEICEAVQEEMHGMKEEPDIKCRICGSAMKRIITGGAGTHYKGNGWPRKGTGTTPNPRRITQKTLVGRPPPSATPDPRTTLKPILDKAGNK